MHRRRLSSFLQGERHSVAELLQLTHVMTLLPMSIQVGKIVSSQILIGLLFEQDMIDDYQDAVRHCDNGFLLATPMRDPMVLGGEIVIFGMRDRPGGFGQGSFEVEIAWRRGSTEPLAPTLLIAGAYSRPGREMLGRGKPRQIDPNLGQDRGCGRLLDADDALGELHGFFKRAQMLLNL